MIMTEFYRQRIAKIEKEIRAAELDGDYSKVATLMKEKSEWEERAVQDGVKCIE